MERNKYKPVGWLSLGNIVILFLFTPLSPVFLVYIFNVFRKALIEEFNYYEVNLEKK